MNFEDASVWVCNVTGKRWRRNGKTKLWKTRPDQFKIPVKHGLYQYGYITDTDKPYYTIES